MLEVTQGHKAGKQKHSRHEHLAVTAAAAAMRQHSVVVAKVAYNERDAFNTSV